MTLIELYSKDECHLCDEAKIVLEKVQQKIPFTLREIKLSPGEDYYEDYKEMIPVVHINKAFVFKYRINESLLTFRLLQLSNSNPSLADGEQAA
jgi:glutaredoxin